MKIETERFQRLQAMGLTPLWRVRARWLVPASSSDAHPPTLAASALTSEKPPLPATRWTLVAPRPAGGAFSVPRDRAAGEDALGTQAVRPADRFADPQSCLALNPERAARIATLDWAALEAEIHACHACPLAHERTQAVPGVGDRRAEWLFVGEGPGREEDRLGEPFVGPAGKLLDEMLFALGLRRGQNVYIANAVKCRPPLNRTPHVEEIAACFPFLACQIALIQPKLIVALGKPAALALLNQEVKIAQARGKRFSYEGIPVVVTYHPAYLLRNPADKPKAWADLLFARRLWREAHANEYNDSL